jgi:solute:Na+ symporter, SSS family
LHVLDLAIIFGYLAAVIAAGGWFGRRQKSTRQYFFGGKQVPWYAIAGSIVATETSAVSFISVPGIAYARGGDFTFLQLVFGYLVGRVVICILFIPSYFQGQLSTVYELLQSRFGAGVKALAASLFVIMRTVADAVRLLLTSIVMASVIRVFDPEVNTTHAISGSILVIAAVMLTFTLMGGIEAVIWTEAAHISVYVVGAIAAGWVLCSLIPGGFPAAIAIGQAHQKFRVLDFTFDLTRSYVFWAGVIGGCFLTMSTHGTDQSIVQRYLCTDKARKAMVALLTSGVVVLIQFIGFLLLGELLFAYYRPDLLPNYLTGPKSAPFALPDQVFPDFMTHHLPTGLSGLVVAAVLAAATSPNVNAIAMTAVADLYSPIVRGRSDQHYLSVSRLFTLLAGVAQMCVALLLQFQARSALDSALSVAALINGPILGVFLLAAAKRGGRSAALVGMSCGIAAVVTVWLATDVAWPWYTVVGSLTTFIIGSVVAVALHEGALPAAEPSLE